MSFVQTLLPCTESKLAPPVISIHQAPQTMQLPLPMAAAEICRQESSPSGLAQVFPCSSRIPSSCPSSYQLVSASSWSTTPIPLWDRHLPHPIACASVNAAKRIESNQFCRACQKHRDSEPYLIFEPWGNCPLGAFGLPYSYIPT